MIYRTAIALRRCAQAWMPEDRKKAGPLRRGVLSALLFPWDLLVVRRKYKDVFGVRPRLLRPRTFNEYIQRRKLFSNSSRYAILADKLKVREFARSRLGEDYFPRILWEGKTISDLDVNELPSSFVIKTNHSWKTNIIVTDKQAVDWEDVKERTSIWLKEDYSLVNAEKQYRWIPPQVFVEEYVKPVDKTEPDEYKVFCFHGRGKLIQIHEARFGDHANAFVDTALNPVNVARPGAKKLTKSHKGCPFVKEMIQIAERLAQGERFLRVDFMVADRLYLSELTLTPAAGFAPFEPSSADRFLGRMMQ